MFQRKIYNFLNDNSNNLSKEYMNDINLIFNNKETFRDKDKRVFNLPIHYLEDKYSLSDSIKADLELVHTKKDDKTTLSLYNHVLNPTTTFSTNLINQWGEYYTDNKNFIRDTQFLLKDFKHISPDKSYKDIQEIENIYKDIDNETGFYEKYKYVSSPFLKGLNNNGCFLQLFTIYNLASPILSMLIPVILLIVPFFILRMKKIPIKLATYINILKTIIKHHGLGKSIMEFSGASIKKKMFIIFSIIFYLVNIYQNFMSCHKFYKNIYKIRNYLLSTSRFLTHSIDSITNFNKYCKSTYLEFSKKNIQIRDNLIKFNNEIKCIHLEKLYLRQITKIGDVLKSFYKLFKNDTYYDSVKYALYFNGYIENILSIKHNILEKRMNYCKFTNSATRFKGGYYAALINDSPVKNSYKLSKNILLTGPNAAGKTTLLKSTIFNIILSQQFGVGCFKSAHINPYNFIYSYINIPDTSERDSLFQAEARRCKEILESVSANKINTSNIKKLKVADLRNLVKQKGLVESDTLQTLKKDGLIKLLQEN